MARICKCDNHFRFENDICPFEAADLSNPTEPKQSVGFISPSTQEAVRSEKFNASSPTEEAPLQEIQVTPDYLRELDNPMAAAHLEALERYEPQRTNVRKELSAIIGDFYEILTNRVAAEMNQVSYDIAQKTKAKIQNLVNQAVIKELENIPGQTLSDGRAKYIGERILELKSLKEKAE